MLTARRFHEREEDDEGDKYAEEGFVEQERRRRGGEESRSSEQGDDPGSTVDQIGHRELEQYDHETVGSHEEPYLPVRHPDEVLGVDEQGLPVLGEYVVEQDPDTEQEKEGPVRERRAERPGRLAAFG